MRQMSHTIETGQRLLMFTSTECIGTRQEKSPTGFTDLGLIRPAMIPSLEELVDLEGHTHGYVDVSGYISDACERDPGFPQDTV